MIIQYKLSETSFYIDVLFWVNSQTISSVLYVAFMIFLIHYLSLLMLCFHVCGQPGVFRFIPERVCAVHGHLPQFADRYWP